MWRYSLHINVALTVVLLVIHAIDVAVRAGQQGIVRLLISRCRSRPRGAERNAVKAYGAQLRERIPRWTRHMKARKRKENEIRARSEKDLSYRCHKISFIYLSRSIENMIKNRLSVGRWSTYLTGFASFYLLSCTFVHWEMCAPHNVYLVFLYFDLWSFRGMAALYRISIKKTISFGIV